MFVSSEVLTCRLLKRLLDHPMIYMCMYIYIYTHFHIRVILVFECRRSLRGTFAPGRKHQNRNRFRQRTQRSTNSDKHRT